MKSTVINTTDFRITSARDDTVEGFYANKNNKLDHLPTNIGEKFPNLVTLFAAACSIREISKENFEGLNKLRYLTLASNQIERIDDDTFEHIPAVKTIDLSE